MSKSQREIEQLKATVIRLIEEINKQNNVISKLAYMCAEMHYKVFPELYDDEGNLAINDQTDRPDTQIL